MYKSSLYLFYKIISGVISNATEKELQELISPSTISLKSSTSVSDSVPTGLNNCREFCAETYDITRCMSQCIIHSYDTNALLDMMTMQLPKCTYSCEKMSQENWSACYNICLEQKLNLPKSMLSELFQFVDFCTESNGKNKTEMCSTTACLTSVISRQENLHQDVLLSLNCWNKCLHDPKSALCTTKCIGKQNCCYSFMFFFYFSRMVFYI